MPGEWDVISVAKADTTDSPWSVVSVGDQPEPKEWSVVSVGDKELNNPAIAALKQSPVYKLAEQVDKASPVIATVAKEVWKQSPMGRTWQAGEWAEEKSREGLKMIADAIPSLPETDNAFLKGPRTLVERQLRGAEAMTNVMAEFAPFFISPQAIVLEGAGPIISAAGKPLGKVAAAAWERLPTRVRELAVEWLTSKGGRPDAYLALKDAAELQRQEYGELAIKAGKALSEGLTPGQQERVGQIVRGSISTSEREADLVFRAGVARSAIDMLETRAKELGLLPETMLNNLSNAQRADLRKRMAFIHQRIDDLKNFGQSTREQLLNKANKVSVGGVTGVVRSVEKAEQAIDGLKDLLDSTKGVITGNQFAGIEDLLSQETIRRNRTMQSILQRFQSGSIGDQEKIFARLAIAADRAGLKVADIYEQGVSVTNLQGLMTRIAEMPRTFPGRQKMINNLRRIAVETEKKIADSYRVAGQKYMPRMYLPKELVRNSDDAFNYIEKRIKRDRFMGRMDLPAEVRKAMGEITKPAYPVAKGIMQVGEAVSKAGMFKSVAENGAWATADESMAAARGWIKMPDVKGLGALAGKFVDPKIAADINEITRAKTVAEKVYKNLIGKWKFGKVILNPATHFRNMMSNAILMDLGGVDLLKQPAALADSVNEYRSAGKMFKEAKSAGLFGKEFFGAEIKEFGRALEASSPELGPFGKMLDMSARLGNKAGKMYQAEEQIFKMAKFMENRRAGMSVADAVADAQKYLFDYSRVPKAIDVWRNRMVMGAPFITFTSKALPVIAEAALTRPLSIYKYHALFDAMENVAKEKLGISQDDINAIHGAARGQVVVLPVKDTNGDPLVLDLSYLLPWGDIGEGGGFAGLPPSIAFGGPLKALFEIGFNQSLYRDAPIWSPEDTASERAAKISDFLLKAWLPTMTPGVPGRFSPFRGGYSYEKLRAGMTGAPEYPSQRVRDMKQVIPDTMLGLRATPTNIGEVKIRESLDTRHRLEQVEADFSRDMRHKGIKPSEKEIIKERFKEKIQRILSK